MKKVFSTRSADFRDSTESYSEIVHIFEFDSEDEAEDFPILSHNEQLSACGFKEERTPSKGTVHRYIVDASDNWVVIRETIMSW